MTTTMADNTVSFIASTQNRVLGSKAIDSYCSTYARLRSSKEKQPDIPSTTNRVPFHLNDQRASTSGDVLRTIEDSTIARMTQKRQAYPANLEDDAICKAPGSPTHTEESLEDSTESIGQICLCQPDPKIPRPRNAFILYRQRHQQSIVAQHPRLPNPEISKIAGELWRTEPESVKNEWKLLADEEKTRHAQQYPDYRFQPRHKSKTSQITVASERIRCNKCGGRSIITTGPPFSTTPGSNPRKPSISVGDNPPPTPPWTAESTKSSAGIFQDMRKLTIDPNRRDPCHANIASPTVRRYHDGPVENLPDPKRARHDGWNPSSPARVDGHRISNGSHYPQALYPYSPRDADPRKAAPRRVSLQQTRQQAQPNGLPYHSQRTSPQRVSPPTPSSGNIMMGPPPPRQFPQGVRSELHAYPSTPTNAPPSYNASNLAHMRRESEALHLPSLLLPGAPDQSRSVEAMVMSIPFLNKIKLLRRIAPPIPDPSPISPSPHIRGTILAIEGDDPVAIQSVLEHLTESLKRSDEFDVRTMNGPKHPECGANIKDFMVEIATWHDKCKHIADFITGAEYMRGESQQQERGESQQREIKAQSRETSIITIKDNEGEQDSMSEGEILEGEREDSHDVKRAVEKPKAQKVEQEPLCTGSPSSTTTSISAEKRMKIPLLLINNYILHASNIWAAAVPIADSYSPADHFTWMSTLWRGIIGADLTVYVRSGDAVDAEAGAEREKEWPESMSLTSDVEMKEDGTIVVRKNRGKVDEASARRVAFEVGEFARRSAKGKGL